MLGGSRARARARVRVSGEGRKGKQSAVGCREIWRRLAKRGLTWGGRPLANFGCWEGPGIIEGIVLDLQTSQPQDQDLGFDLYFCA
jgi:hypothetical protein